MTQATASAKNVYISPDKKKLLYTAQAEYQLPDGIIPPVLATNTQPEERKLELGGIYIYDSEEDRNYRIGTELNAENPASNPAKQLLSVDLFNSQAMSLDSSPSAFVKLQATSSAQIAKNFQDYYTSLYQDSFQWFPDSNHVIHAAGTLFKSWSTTAPMLPLSLMANLVKILSTLPLAAIS